MKKPNKKIISLSIMIISILVLTTSYSSAGVQERSSLMNGKMNKQHINPTPPQTLNADYWGLIFAVGVYRDNPDADRPTMLETADALYDTLVEDPNWQPDHIHKVTGSQATGKALVNELLWLIQNTNEEDMVVIYLTTHGSALQNSQGLPVDLPPKDELDGADEMLIMYDFYATGYSFIWDDFLNFFLSFIKANGLCLIVDSCYSGGFNDEPFVGFDYSAEAFTQGLMEELSTENRVVIMSSEEYEVSYGSQFSNLLIDGFWGLADFFGNGDSINSAEEAFDYAKFWLDLIGEQHPTIYDLYPGDFPITT